MKNMEFVSIMAYLGLACGKPLTPEAQVVYFDLLGDLPAEAMQAAARRVMLEHPWSTFPSVAELRAAAVDTIRGDVKELSAGEAWELAWKAVGRIDLDIDGSMERALKGLPPAVVETMRQMGIPSLIYGQEPVGVLRGQFAKFYESVAARDRRTDLLPESTKKQLDVVRETGKLPSQTQRAITQIGTMPMPSEN